MQAGQLCAVLGEGPRLQGPPSVQVLLMVGPNHTSQLLLGPPPANLSRCQASRRDMWDMVKDARTCKLRFILNQGTNFYSIKIMWTLERTDEER